MSFSRLRAIISTVCVFDQYTRSKEKLGSEQQQVASLTSDILNVLRCSPDRRFCELHKYSHTVHLCHDCY